MADEQRHGVHSSPRSRSATAEVTDSRNADIDSRSNTSSQRMNPFNTLKPEAAPIPEKTFQSFQDQALDSGRTVRHCHRVLDTSTNSVARRQLLAVTLLCLLFMILEAVGGILANSLALFTDVLHLGSDLINFLVCLLAQWLTSRPVTRKMTFGYHRAEILGALFSVVFIWTVSGMLCYMATDRIMHDRYRHVRPDEMLVTAAVGLMFNIVMGIALHFDACFTGARSHGALGHTHSDKSDKSDLIQDKDKAKFASFDVENGVPPKSDDGKDDLADEDRKDSVKQRNINVRAAFIHVVGDTIQSLGVLMSALIIKFAPNPTYKLADPICTFVFSLIVLTTTLVILRDVLAVFMEGVPRNISFVALKKELAALDGVVAVHNLQIWALTMDKTCVAVHLVIEHLHLHDQVLASATRLLQDKHRVHFTTIQVELFHETMNTCQDCLRFNS